MPVIFLLAFTVYVELLSRSTYACLCFDIPLGMAFAHPEEHHWSTDRNGYENGYKRQRHYWESVQSLRGSHTCLISKSSGRCSDCCRPVMSAIINPCSMKLPSCPMNQAHMPCCSRWDADHLELDWKSLTASVSAQTANQAWRCQGKLALRQPFNDASIKVVQDLMSWLCKCLHDSTSAQFGPGARAVRSAQY